MVRFSIAHCFFGFLADAFDVDSIVGQVDPSSSPSSSSIQPQPKSSSPYSTPPPSPSNLKHSSTPLYEDTADSFNSLWRIVANRHPKVTIFPCSNHHLQIARPMVDMEFSSLLSLPCCLVGNTNNNSNIETSC
jgi:hypothetical protein